jgi:hypothetical protein
MMARGNRIDARGNIISPQSTTPFSGFDLALG